ncbi:MAG: citrate synthase family protein, partial [Deltaproteobacteria bacterium]|nr:citrate synthase family protein [Deltaproteobacteria bacterium]
MSAQEAARWLGVKPATLYAYVSRGLLKSVPGRGRARLYARAELERLRARASRGGDATPSTTRGQWVSDALAWGEPVLESAITEIGPAGPRYRGVDAVALVESGARFEDVAERLWGAGGQGGWDTRELGVRASAITALVPREAPPLVALSVLVPALGALDQARWDTSPKAVAARARVLVRRMAAGLALGGAAETVKDALEADTVAGTIATAMGARRGRDGVSAIDRALVAIADHELNVSTFAARVAASGGADLYACVTAALAALSGPRHGGACDRIEAMSDEAETNVGHARDPKEKARHVIDARARRGDPIPGFEHPLYPSGDPRSPPLLAIAEAIGSRERRVETLRAIVDVMRARGRQPTVDVALVTMAAALGMPAGAATGVFAVGRTAGWVAHVLEQQATGVMLRPRGR